MTSDPDSQPSPESPTRMDEPRGAVELPGPGQGDQVDQTAIVLADVGNSLERLADETKRYHARAEQREAVIDRMHQELESLRRGERRSLLRPLLTEVCRLRDDLLRQAGQLPENFDAADAGELLRSYAESMTIALADNGVVTYEPQIEDAFEPREQRAVGKTPNQNEALAGKVASVLRAGYLDLETNVPLCRAEVVVFVAQPPIDLRGTSTSHEPVVTPNMEEVNQ
jgi:molecular chaperone GrpE